MISDKFNYLFGEIVGKYDRIIVKNCERELTVAIIDRLNYYVISSVLVEIPSTV